MEGSANYFAFFVIWAWPVLTLVVFAKNRGKMSIARTAAWMMCLGLLLLPAEVSLDAPGVPAIDKPRLPFLAILLALRVYYGPAKPDPSTSRFNRIFLVGLLWSVLGTVLTNQDELVYGPLTVVALKHYDIVSVGVSLLFDWYVPFTVGQRVFQTEQDLIDLFEVLTVCCIAYLPLVLFEIRFSPQLHLWIYGLRPSAFTQAIRAGGFRPQVFFHHGLSLAFFAFMGVTAAFGLRKAKVASKKPTTRARMWGTVFLIAICKSLGSAIYAFATAMLQAFGSPKTIARTIFVILVLVISYPMSRSTGVFPAAELVETFENAFSKERAESMEFRFLNEDALLAKAALRPMYGFGTYGRGRVYSDEGRDISVTDGYWAILLTGFGYLGFFLFFSLLVVPLVRYLRRRSQMPERSQHLVGALALIVAFTGLDLLPNGLWSQLPLAFAGGLLGIADRVGRAPPAPVAAGPARQRSPGRVYA